MHSTKLAAFDEFVDRRSSDGQHPGCLDDSQEQRFGREWFREVQHHLSKPLANAEPDNKALECNCVEPIRDVERDLLGRRKRLRKAGYGRSIEVVTESGEDTFEPDDWFSTPGVDFALFGRNIHVQTHAMGEEEHRRFLDEMKATLPTLEADRDALHAELLEILRSGDARELLMQFAIPYLVINPNTWKEWESNSLPVHVEYLALQVLALDQDPDAFGPGAEDPRDIQARLHRTDEILKQIFELEMHRTMLDTRLNVDPSRTEFENEARSQMLTRSLIVRYSTYQHHERRIAESLLGPIGDECVAVVGFTFEDAIRCLDALPKCFYEPIFERLDEAMAQIQRTESEVKRVRRRPSRSGDAHMLAMAKLKPTELRDQLRAVATTWAFYGSRVHTRVTASRLAILADIDEARAQSFLTLFTARVEDFDPKHHAKPCPTHPLLDHPLVPDGDGCLISVLGNMLTALVPRIEDELQKDGRFWHKYEQHRAAWLEDETARILGQALDGSRVEKRSMWRVDDKRKGEVDVAVRYGEVGLRAECKAGRVTPSARRGGIDRIRTDLEKLVGEASAQLGAVVDAVGEFGCDAIGLSHLADVFDAPLQIRIVVVLEDLSTFSAQAFTLRQFGTLTPDEPIPWVVSLSDLYVITDLIENTGLIHYLTRREKLNRIGRVWAHEELDWLGHYLHEGLYFDETFSAQDAPDFYRLLSYTDSIDSWYFAETGARSAQTSKPAIKHPDSIARVIRHLETTRPDGFVAACVVVRDWSEESWHEFDSQLAATRRRALDKGWGSLTMFFQNYGLCWHTEFADPASLEAKVAWLASRDRGDQLTKPLCVALGETRSGPLELAVHASGEPAASYEAAFLDPFRSGVGLPLAVSPDESQ